jgi:hypothetical protein
MDWQERIIVDPAVLVGKPVIEVARREGVRIDMPEEIPVTKT